MKNDNLNKYGVPHKRFAVTLANGRGVVVDIGDESDWGNIQQMNPGDWFAEGKDITPDDWANRIGWGNDCDGHIEITGVVDTITCKLLDTQKWAEMVWSYADKYSA